MKDSSTLHVLKEIRDAVRATNARVDSTNTRMDEMREELSRRIVASEVRTATALTDLTGAVHEVASLLRAQHDLRPRVERCENDIAELKRRVPA